MDLALLAHRLKPVMEQDAHQQGASYEIRSVYFDDVFDSCMDENAAGVDDRKKYRIRTYGPASPINLEIKEKQHGLTRKAVCGLSREEYAAIMEGGQTLAPGQKRTLNRLLLQMRCVRMRPKTVVTYERTAFVYPAGNVRITFDRNIMASRAWDSFLNPQIAGLVPVLPAGMHVLEVKYDELLPDVIAEQMEIKKLQQTSFSKYYLGRLAVNGEFLF